LAVTGTGWSSDLEHRARVLFKQRGVPTVAVLDHWVNYPQRFEWHGERVLPDVLWVADSYALDLAKSEFPGLQIRQFANAYLSDLIADIPPPRPMGNTIRVLYALEPIRTAWLASDPRAGEFQALDYFLSRLADLGLEHADIRLRPHPTDPPGKYEQWLTERSQGYRLSLDAEKSVAQSVTWADVVVGCESFVLVTALAAGRRVISTLPPWAPPMRLPHEGIVRLCAS
jgi:hypothetical protein